MGFSFIFLTVNLFRHSTLIEHGLYMFTIIHVAITTALQDNATLIVIPWIVRLYVDIIHELWRVDYLTYRWTNMV